MNPKLQKNERQLASKRRLSWEIFATITVPLLLLFEENTPKANTKIRNFTAEACAASFFELLDIVGFGFLLRLIVV